MLARDLPRENVMEAGVLSRLASLILLAALVDCTSGTSTPRGAQSPDAGASAQATGPKRLTVGIFEIPFALNSVVNATFPGITGGSVRGIRYVEPMVSAMVTVPDGD